MASSPAHRSLSIRRFHLTDYETIVRLIAATTTAKGLTVTCRLDRRRYPSGRKISDEQFAVNLTPDIFHGTEKHKGLVHFLTIHGNAQRISIASAPREVLAALRNMTPERGEQIIELRNTDAILKLEDFRDIFGGDYPQVSPYIGMDESGIFSIESAGFMEEGKPGYAIQATAVAEKPSRLRSLYYRSPAGWTP